jgi:antibiotic biosynthesis monooxygenase (ABM) superfamily enzyme
MDLHIARASAVVVQRVPSGAADWFMEWQRGVHAAAEGFTGFQGTDIYPPPAGQGDEWVATIHFDGENTLQAWLTSKVRAELVEKLQAKVGDFELKTLPGGLGPWFAGSDKGPPGWKMVLTVLLGLYPTVMLLLIFVGPSIEKLGIAVSMLISNALSVSILQWGVMPVLTFALGPWLRPRPSRRAVLWVGPVLILGLLAALAVAFRQMTK